MANEENLIPNSERTPSERKEIARNGGIASGKARRKKADFRKTLNLLLTTEIESEEWTPLLESLGLESTLESAVNMAMIRKALAGDVKAYEAIAKYSGQSTRTDEDEKRQQLADDKTRAEIDAIRAKVQTDDEEDAEDDGFIDALNASAGGDWSEYEEDNT